MGVGDPGCYNRDSKIPTPNIDRLAREGVRMTDMHSPSAVCTPTRYGLLTGRYCWRTRLKESVLFGYGTALIEPDRATLASLLQGHGYRTAVFGKWHLGLGDGEKTDYSKPLSPGPLSTWHPMSMSRIRRLSRRPPKRLNPPITFVSVARDTLWVEKLLPVSATSMCFR